MRKSAITKRNRNARLRSGRVWIGTSGWHYKHWIGPFYPAELPKKSMLSFYAERFQTVEINNSFYHLVPKEALRAWRETVPDEFLFAAKGSRFITHMLKLKDPQRALERYFEHMRVLGKKLVPIVFQLPPKWRYNGERLREFVDALPAGYRYAFEFREPSWLNEETQALFRERNIAVCLFHLAGYQAPDIVTGDFIYVRLHGPGGKYEGRYSQRTLEEWAGKIRRWRGAARDVYCYFDNDQAGYAVGDALRLRALVGDEQEERSTPLSSSPAATTRNRK